MSQEVVFSYKTRGNSSTKDKPRVYFTCHPDDFDRYFEKICEDIFKTHDCAIYYTDDMSADLSNENNLVDLERMNLFVIPVTFRLLTQPNRAMDSDFRFAMGKHIPVLPMMMEPGIDEFYSKPDKFGELQYINPYSHDLTEISYEEKLKKHLESVLISDELAQRVRKAFDAYIFLSYRKKDRAYANELMKLIHKNPECRDIAIWFDEFLTPGESFKDNITRILNNSELFTLLVTPNLLEMPNGKPNFVMAEEYPAARDLGKNILPTEMEQTDKSSLFSLFNELPACVNARDDIEFREKLLDSLKRFAISENNSDPEHNYLIGLAYLEGIDVEVNIDYGIGLIISAGESGNLEAMERLYLFYHQFNTGHSYGLKALYWAKKIVEYITDKQGLESIAAIQALEKLADAYNTIGEYTKQIEIRKKVCDLSTESLKNETPLLIEKYENLSHAYRQIEDNENRLKVLNIIYDMKIKLYGSDHPKTLETLWDISNLYGQIGDYRKEIDLCQKSVEICRLRYGENDLQTLEAMTWLARAYSHIQNNEQALKLRKEIFNIKKNRFGEANSIEELRDIASSYKAMEEWELALEVLEIIYNICCNYYGENGEKSIEALIDLSIIYRQIGKKEKVIEHRKKIYDIRRVTMGEENPCTIESMEELAHTYEFYEEYNESLSLRQRIYDIRCKFQGCEHEDTVYALESLANSYGRMGDTKKEIELRKKGYEIRCKVYGLEHPETLDSMSSLSRSYERNGDIEEALKLGEMSYAIHCRLNGELASIYELYDLSRLYESIDNKSKSIELKEKAYLIRCNSFGEDNALTLESMYYLASAQLRFGDTKKGVDLLEKIYQLRKKVLGESHPDTIESINHLASAYEQLNKEKEAIEMRELAYKICRDAFGKDSPDTMRALEKLKDTYDCCKCFEKSIIVGSKICRVNINKFGINHPTTLISFKSLASSYSKLGNIAIAIQLLEYVFELGYGKTYGTAKYLIFPFGSSDYLRHLAWEYGRVGDKKKQSELESKIYKIESGEKVLVSICNLPKEEIEANLMKLVGYNDSNEG